MKHVLVDSNVLLASRDMGSGARHERAAEVVRGIDHGDLPVAHLTEHVLAETLNFMHARGYHAAGAAFHDALSRSAGFETHRTTGADFTDAVDLYGEREALSFVDGVLVAYMRRTGIEYVYTFDDEFDSVEGVTPLSTAVDPYA